MATKKHTPSWSNVKAKLADFDRTDLLKLVQELYGASRDNQMFLHVRLGLLEDVLEPFKATITRWINPDDPRRTMSVAKARQALSDYRKVLGQPQGLAELAVFYCEEVFAFLAVCGMEDETYYEALVDMFAQAVKYALALPEAQRTDFLTRLDRVRYLGQDVGWCVGDDFNHIWLEAGLPESA